MLIDTRKSPYAKVYSLPAQDVEWAGGFWKERFDACADVTVPHIRKLFEDPDPVFHVVENFRVACGEHEGTHEGTPFGDGDFYKWMEAAMYVAAKRNDGQLKADLDGYIRLIASVQQPDGYLSTKQIIADMKGGNSRLGDINDFEVYNFGHMFTAACIYYRLFGKRDFLDVAEKVAGYLAALYKRYLEEGVAQTEVCPSHYMGIVELYRTTGKPEYLTLARQALAVRDLVPSGTDDNQDSAPLRTHRKIVGHGVRSTYLYAGVADVYAEDGDKDFREVLDAVWHSCTDQKLYITGGVGALYYGVSPYGIFPGLNNWKVYNVHQAFGYEYQLPNITAYNESCASLGNIMWNLRMFAVDPQAKYFDLIERSMFNLTAAAVSLGGNKFFYENMLRRVLKLDFELVWPTERREALICFCCPPNIARFLAESSEYAYMVSDDAVWAGMYGSSRAGIALQNGAAFTLVQSTRYPWDGLIRFTFEDIKADSPFTLNLRIPGWLQSGNVKLNGALAGKFSADDASTYYKLRVDTLAGAVVELQLDMPVRMTVAHSKVEETLNQVAVERGPLVYCVETPDAPEADDLTNILLPADAVFEETSLEIGGSPVVALKTEGMMLDWGGARDTEALYQTLPKQKYKPVGFRMIPYYAWDNRGMGEMNIWMPVFWGKH